VGFIFSLDLRDQCVDAAVVRVVDGQIKRGWDGGYSAGLYTHLVEKAGYRGGPGKSSASGLLEQMIEGWADLLQKAGQSLLDDRVDSLPT